MILQVYEQHGTIPLTIIITVSVASYVEASHRKYKDFGS